MWPMILVCFAQIAKLLQIIDWCLNKLLYPLNCWKWRVKLGPEYTIAPVATWSKNGVLGDAALAIVLNEEEGKKAKTQGCSAICNTEAWILSKSCIVFNNLFWSGHHTVGSSLP